ncbi:putative immunity protein [Nocardia xishanensis]|uniref:putative immunity protein n=1 Tax=Nocardia xishanensis TaxID=238964 RepID=UPI003F53F3C7
MNTTSTGVAGIATNTSLFRRFPRGIQPILPQTSNRVFNDTVDTVNAADEDMAIELSMAELREVTGYALACAEPLLAIFERDCPDDPRPRAVLDEARRFAAGGKRTKALRVTALEAHRAARAAAEMRYEAAADAARAAGHAGAAAYLHPLAKATQGGHILMSAAHAARALELDVGDDRNVGDEYIEKATGLAGPVVVSVLTRYPPAPRGRGRVGDLWRKLDASLRQLATDR